MTFDTGIIKHPDENLVFIEVFFVVYPEVIFAYILPQVDNSRMETIQANAFFPLRSEDQGFALFQEQGFHGLGAFFGEDLESSVIKDIAVLIDFEEGCAPMALAAKQHLLQVFGVPVHAAGHKAGISPHRKLKRIERMVDAAERG